MGVFFLVLLYLLPPSGKFPLAPPDAVQSLEEADTEIPLRRAYFTNYNREEVIKHYRAALGTLNIFGFKRAPVRLNYPPEESNAIIRDQTRSTFLEEVVYPFRESLYINGFKPKSAKDDIWYNGAHFEQKITVFYIPTNTIARITIFTLSFILFRWVILQFSSIIYRLAIRT